MASMDLEVCPGEVFEDNSHLVKHQYLIIEDPDTELFRITDNPPNDSVYYPVTVFDKEEEK